MGQYKPKDNPKEYSRWLGMKDRCYNENSSQDYKKSFESLEQAVAYRDNIINHGRKMD